MIELLIIVFLKIYKLMVSLSNAKRYFDRKIGQIHNIVTFANGRQALKRAASGAAQKAIRKIMKIVTKCIMKALKAAAKFIVVFADILIWLMLAVIIFYGLTFITGSLTSQSSTQSENEVSFTFKLTDDPNLKRKDVMNEKVLQENFYKRVSDISFYQTFNMIDKQERLSAIFFKDLYEKFQVFVPWVDWDKLLVKDANGVAIDYLKPATGLNTPEAEKLGGNFLRDYSNKESKFLLSPTLLAELNRGVFEAFSSNPNQTIKYPENFIRPVHYVFDYMRVDEETGEEYVYRTERDEKGEVISEPSLLVCDYAVLERNAYEIFTQNFEKNDSKYQVASNNVSKYGAYEDKDMRTTYIAKIYYKLKKGTEFGKQVKDSDVEGIYLSFEDYKAGNNAKAVDGFYVFEGKTYSSEVSVESADAADKENQEAQNPSASGEITEEDILAGVKDPGENKDNETELKEETLKVPAEFNTFPRQRYQLAPLFNEEGELQAKSSIVINIKEVKIQRLTDKYKYSDQYIIDLENYLNEHKEDFIFNDYYYDNYEDPYAVNQMVEDTSEEEKEEDPTASPSPSPSADPSDPNAEEAEEKKPRDTLSSVEKYTKVVSQVNEYMIEEFTKHIFEVGTENKEWEFSQAGSQSEPVAAFEKILDSSSPYYGQSKIVKNKDLFKKSNFKYIINGVDRVTKNYTITKEKTAKVKDQYDYIETDVGEMTFDPAKGATSISYGIQTTDKNTNYYWDEDLKTIVDQTTLYEVPLEIKSVRDFGLGSILSYIEGRKVKFKSGISYIESYQPDKVSEYFEANYPDGTNKSLTAYGFYPHQIVDDDPEFVDTIAKNPQEQKYFESMYQMLHKVPENVDGLTDNPGNVTVEGLTFASDGSVYKAGASGKMNVSVFGPQIDPQIDQAGLFKWLADIIKKNPDKNAQYLNPKKYYLYWFDRMKKADDDQNLLQILGDPEFWGFPTNDSNESGVIHKDSQVGEGVSFETSAVANGTYFSKVYEKDLATKEAKALNSSGFTDFDYITPMDIEQVFMIEEALTFAGNFMYSYEDKVEKVGNIENEKRVVDAFFTNRYYYAPNWDIKATGKNYSVTSGTGSYTTPGESAKPDPTLEDGETLGAYTTETISTTWSHDECDDVPDGKGGFKESCTDYYTVTFKYKAEIIDTKGKTMSASDLKEFKDYGTLPFMKIFNDKVPEDLTGKFDEKTGIQTTEADYVSKDTAKKKLKSEDRGFELENAEALRNSFGDDPDADPADPNSGADQNANSEATIFGDVLSSSTMSKGDDRDARVDLSTGQKLTVPEIPSSEIISKMETVKTDSDGLKKGFEPDGDYELKLPIAYHLHHGNPIPLYKVYSGYIKQIMPKELEYYYNGESYTTWIKRMNATDISQEDLVLINEEKNDSKKYIEEYLMAFETYIPYTVKDDKTLNNRGGVNVDTLLPTEVSRPTTTSEQTMAFYEEASKPYWDKIYEGLGMSKTDGQKAIAQILQGIAEESKNTFPTQMMKYYGDIKNNDANIGIMKNFNTPGSLKVSLETEAGQKDFIMTHAGVMSIAYFEAYNKETGEEHEAMLSTNNYGKEIPGDSEGAALLRVGKDNDERLDAEKSIHYAGKKLGRLISYYSSIPEAIYAYYTSQEFMNALLSVTSSPVTTDPSAQSVIGTWTNPSDEELKKALELTNGSPLDSGINLDLSAFSPSFVTKVLSYVTTTSSKEQIATGSVAMGSTISGGKQTMVVGSGINKGAYLKANQYRYIVEKYAALYGLDPDIVVAKIALESGGNNISTGAAWGVSQVEDVSYGSKGYPFCRPSTATLADGTSKTICINITKNTATDERLNIEKAIEFGCSELKECIDYYNGDVLKGLQAYNYGRGAMDKLIKAYGDDWMKNTGEMARLMGRTKYGCAEYLPLVLQYYAGKGFTGAFGVYSEDRNTGGYGSQYKSLWDGLDRMIGLDYQKVRKFGVEEFIHYLTADEAEMVMRNAASFRYPDRDLFDFDFTVMDLLGNPFSSSEVGLGSGGLVNGTLSAASLQDFSAYIYNWQTYVTPFKPSTGQAVIKSAYGYRNGPVSGKPNEWHGGLDYGEPAGTPLYSIADGIVAKAEINFGDQNYGNVVYIAHPTDPEGKYYIVSIYGHMRDAPLVKTGEKVTAGQQIGVVGTTGSSTGNHLHFEIRLDYGNYKASPEIKNSPYMVTAGSYNYQTINPFYFGTPNPTPEMIAKYGVSNMQN